MVAVRRQVPRASPRLLRGVIGLLAVALVCHSLGAAWLPPGGAASSRPDAAALGRRGLAGAGVLGVFFGAGAESAKAYDLAPLPYAFDALEPSIDKETMEIHHDRHHNTYVTNINKALEGKDQPPILELQKGAIKAGPAFRNSGGGTYNHNFFWLEMAPTGTGGQASEKLAKAIDESFGSMDGFKEKFEAAGAPGARFGSGWVWLIVNSEGKLEITSTPNQDNPLMDGVDGSPGIPILGLDVWEHAYYLKYQWKRPDYIKAWWAVVNWNQVNTWYEGALLGKAPTTEGTGTATALLGERLPRGTETKKAGMQFNFNFNTGLKIDY